MIPEAASGASYNAAVAAADAAVGKLIARLRTRKLYDDALIVIASDHGESLGGHGEETHGVFLYDETIRVPLLLKLPQNQNAGKRVSARARLVDIAPTILEIAGVPIPSQMQGQSLLRIAKTNADQPVYSVSDFPQQRIRMERAGILACGKISLHQGAPARALRSLGRSRRHAQPGADFQSHAGNHRRPAGCIRPALQRLRQLPEALNLLPAKCRSWRRWDMSACRNPLLPQRRGDRESIRKMGLRPQTRSCRRSRC